ncbi:MAG: type I pullulanase [Firmicutes bacterium]|nr:type I pullulanase [Bacillota bacterium]
MRRIVIHYYRADGDYQPWGVWIWPWGYGGQFFPFQKQDHYGKKVEIEFPRKHKSFGFVIRGPSWEKDIDFDRFVDNFIGDLAEIWLISGDPQIYLAPPAHLRPRVRAFGQLELTIHYYRYDGDYQGWNVWAWSGNDQGRALQFIAEDDYGYVARASFGQTTDAGEIGFILRRSEVGNEWAAKDGGDRLIPLYRASDRGRLEVWLMQDDPRIYYLPEDVDKQPRLLRAKINSLRRIKVDAYLPIISEEEKWGFRLFKNGREVEIAEVKPKGPNWKHPREVLISTASDLDLKAEYVIKHPTHGRIKAGCGQIFASPAFEKLFHYGEDDLGVAYSPQKTTFKVWAPTAEKMELITYLQGEGGSGSAHSMIRSKRGIWSLSLKGDLNGVFYTFCPTFQGRRGEAVDPYARAVGVNGKRGQVLNLKDTDPPGWEKVKRPPLENPVDAVIYEVHIRDFSSSPSSGIKAQGQYLGLVESGTTTSGGMSTGLDHLQDLGITHVHLLPIFDFATVDEANPQSGYNWGYDPQNYNAPEGSYASDPYDGAVRIRELKQLIQGLSQAGIGVIMDVVYNHTFQSLDSSLNRLVPGYYYRTNPDGTFSNGSGCGNELADERSMVRKLIADSVSYWAREYKLSGFRFDLMGLHHLRTMQEIRKALDQIDPEIIIYGEGWAADSSPLPEEERAVKRNTPRLEGIASFCNDLRDGIKGHVFRNKEKGFIQGAGQEESVKFGIAGAVGHSGVDYSQVLYSRAPWAVNPGQAVLYAEAHDNLTLWDKLLVTTEKEQEFDRVAMFKLAQVLVLTGQGIPFLHAGQEFARTKGGDPNSYQSPDHVNQIDWERKEEFYELYEYTRGLIRLRKNRPAFRLRTGKEVRQKLRFLKMPARNMLGYALGPHANGDSYETVLVFVNSNETPFQVALPRGSWDVLADKEGVGSDLGVLRGPLVWVEDRSPLILGKRGGK